MIMQWVFRLNQKDETRCKLKENKTRFCRVQVSYEWVSLGVSKKFGTFVVPGPGSGKRWRQQQRNSMLFAVRFGLTAWPER